MTGITFKKKLPEIEEPRGLGVLILVSDFSWILDFNVPLNCLATPKGNETGRDRQWHIACRCALRYLGVEYFGYSVL